METLNLSTGKLNFHLRQLSGLVQKTDVKFYKLTDLGYKALTLLQQLSKFPEMGHTFSKSILSMPLYSFQPAIEYKNKLKLLTRTLFVTIAMVQLILVILYFKQLILIPGVSATVLLFSIILVMALVLVSEFLINAYYQSIEYEISETEISIKKGIITKSTTIIPFRTVTNLIIKRDFLDRLYGITTLIVETAGESGKTEPEGKLIGLYEATELAEEIINHIRKLDPPKYIRETVSNSKQSPTNLKLLSAIKEALKKIESKL